MSSTCYEISATSQSALSAPELPASSNPSKACISDYKILGSISKRSSMAIFLSITPSSATFKTSSTSFPTSPHRRPPRRTYLQSTAL